MRREGERGPQTQPAGWPERFSRVAAGPDRPRLVVGAMSGTSSDGVSAALVEVSGSGRRRYTRLIAFETYAYKPQTRERIFRLYPPQPFEAAELARVMLAVSAEFAEAIRSLLNQAGVAPAAVHLASLHGPTLYYEPPGPENGWQGLFLELLEASLVAERVGIPVIFDLRSADIAAGGHGAPLSVFGDQVLFADPHVGRIVQNIGGIANPTVLFPAVPAAGPGDKPGNSSSAGSGQAGSSGGAETSGEAGEVLCFDTGPGNMVIDAVVQELTGGREGFDRDGRRAAAGRVHPGLLAELMAHPYIHKAPPKTTGREVFGVPFARELMRRGRELGLSGEDLVATATAFTAESIAVNYRRFVFPRGRIDEVILAGGGARNPVLVRMLADRLPGLRLRPVDELGIPSEAREAVIWAVLGDESCLGRPANVPSASGARHPAILGKLAPGPSGLQRSLGS